MSTSMRSALQKARESCPMPAVGYQRLPQFPPQVLRHPPPPRTNLVTSDSNKAPMAGLMIVEMTPEPRRTPEQTDEFSPSLGRCKSECHRFQLVKSDAKLKTVQNCSHRRLHPSRKRPKAASGRMRSQMILVVASIGTDRIAPGIPHIQNQKTSEMMTRTGLRVNRLARSIGVKVWPSIKCKPR